MAICTYVANFCVSKQVLRKLNMESHNTFFGCIFTIRLCLFEQLNVRAVLTKKGPVQYTDIDILIHMPVFATYVIVIYPYIHTYIPMYAHILLIAPGRNIYTQKYIYKHTYTHACMTTYIQTHMAYMYTYSHACMHEHIHTCSRLRQDV